MSEVHVEWVCNGCEDRPHFLPAEFMEHLTVVHDIPEGTEATRRMLLHLDGGFGWRTTWECTVGDLTFLKLEAGKREASDPMGAYG